MYHPKHAGLCPLTIIPLTLAWLALTTWLAADPPAPPKASSYAPAADLIAQVELYIAGLEEALAKKEDYPESASEARARKLANTLTVLSLTLALHDEPHKLKTSAPALFTAAQTLSKSTKDYDAAVKAFAAVKEAAAGKVASSDASGLKWEKVASLGQIMKQSEIVTTTLKRGITDPRRFKRDAAKSAGEATTLAVIAQASLFDTHEVKNPADVGKWYQMCAEMRDAAAAVNVAAHAGDQKGAVTALERMSLSCEKCHEAFRD